MEENLLREIASFLDEKGRLTQFPAKRKKKLVALAYLREKFVPGRVYSEGEVNDLLEEWHSLHDPATLRRELYNNRLLDRSPDGRTYTPAIPEPKD